MTDSCPKIANPSFVVGSVTEGGILEVLMNRIVLINGLSTKLTMRRGRKRFSLEAALPMMIRTKVVTMSESEIVTKFSTIHFTAKKISSGFQPNVIMS